MQLLGQLGSIVNALAIVGVDGAADLVRAAAGDAGNPRGQGQRAGSRREAAGAAAAREQVPQAPRAAGAGGSARAEEQPNLIADLTEKLGRTPLKRLEQMIDYDEDQAAAILKQWMRGAAKSMSAAPIARYLLELDADDDAGASPASGRAPASRRRRARLRWSRRPMPRASRAARRRRKLRWPASSRSGRRITATSSPRHARHGRSRRAGGLPSSSLKGLEELEARLAETTARILKPFLGAELQRRAIADLVESLTVLRAQEKAAAISVSGAARSSGGAARAARGQVRQCRLSPERGLRRARDGRANGAGNAARRVDGANRGGDEMSGSEEGKSHELVIIRRRANDGRGRAPRRRVEDRLCRLHDGDDGVLSRHVADQLDGQEDADAGCHLFQSHAPDRQAAEPEGPGRARRERGQG